ncbi:MAG: hydrogenase expression/formation protein HypE [Candidatus Proteinoplasmatales archaeon SG8-5]|nr:MAG: hydrogenase expression/formation protein HypE [Candidatus Proteinoplasmatales archaeon SG8-5]
MTHGAGGEAMQKLLAEVILSRLEDNRPEIGLKELDDSGVMDDIVLTMDGHTVNPLFYPGGDIGKLAVCGTINDICAMGAEPVALALGLIMEDGLEMDDISRIMESIGLTCKESGVPVITGDTKVVEKGAIDKLMVTTSGIGRMGGCLKKNNSVLQERTSRQQKWLQDCNLKVGDDVIVTGSLGDHGISLMSFREGYGFETTLQSDNAPLNKLMAEALSIGGIVSAKDPTRGGLANSLNEWSSKSGVGILVKEDELPINQQVRSASELLGIDPLEVGNEGKMVIGVIPEMTEEVLAIIRQNEHGRDARVIGKATDEVKRVVLETVVGGKRIIEAPVGDPVPRIC